MKAQYITSTEEDRANCALDLVSGERGSFTWAAAQEYLVGGLGPGKRFAARVGPGNWMAV
jgi:hypothetical protein